MVLRRVGAFALAITLALTTANTAHAQRFTLSSPAFEDNDMLPVKYAGDMQCGADSRGWQYLAAAHVDESTCGNHEFHHLDD